MSKIQQLAPLLDLKTGSNVAEIGAGNGSVALAAAKQVGPSGCVYATEIEPKRLDRIRKAAHKAGQPNLIVIASRSDDTGLLPASCESIYMIGAYHHLTDPLKINSSIFRALRSGGRLIVVDFRPSLLLRPWAPKNIPANRGGHGIPENILQDELRRAGFQITRVYDHWGKSWFLSNYCIVFNKPDTSAGERSEKNESCDLA